LWSSAHRPKSISKTGALGIVRGALSPPLAEPKETDWDQFARHVFYVLAITE
jgi:hypothetical protein